MKSAGSSPRSGTEILIVPAVPWRRFNRVIEYLGRITPTVLDVEAVSVDANYNLRFEFAGGGKTAEEFPSQNVSDGTLRALTVLVALFQTSDRYPLTLTGLEEPEAGLHPAAAGVLFDSLVEASHFGQVVVTSHSPDLLNRDDIPEGAIKAVEMCEGHAIIGRVDDLGRSALRERLYTAGELLRINQLRPEGSPTAQMPGDLVSTLVRPGELDPYSALFMVCPLTSGRWPGANTNCLAAVHKHHRKQALLP